MRINTAQQLNSGKNFCLIGSAGAAEHQQICVGNLIIEELSEVSHVHSAFSGIHNRDLRPDFNAVYRTNGFCHIRKLSNS